mmetsp:Transcript_58138/g.107024  ORF Transcript_58138/g.107024 Transcript_58138/m.107024 type:complete len:216 (-) Transcript_58138:269-916(-)
MRHSAHASIFQLHHQRGILGRTPLWIFLHSTHKWPTVWKVVQHHRYSLRQLRWVQMGGHGQRGVLSGTSLGSEVASYIPSHELRILGVVVSHWLHQIAPARDTLKQRGAVLQRGHASHYHVDALGYLKLVVPPQKMLSAMRLKQILIEKLSNSRPVEPERPYFLEHVLRLHLAESLSENFVIGLERLIVVHEFHCIVRITKEVQCKNGNAIDPIS